MKIEIKDIHYSEALSKDTNAFSASLYIDGVLVGIAENNGYGGETNYHATDPKYTGIIQEAEIYCNGLPKVKSPYVDEDGKSKEFEQTLASYIDGLVEHYLEKKNADNLKRHEKKKLLYGNLKSGQVFYIVFKRSLAGILAHPNGEEALATNIRNLVLPNLKEGMKMLNHNLPESVYQKAGLGKHQYISPEPPTTKQHPPKQKPGRKKGKGPIK